MKSMRNVIAHESGVSDHDLLWNALAVSLPLEVLRIRRAFEES